MDFGKKLRRFRNRHRWTLVDLANRLEVHYSTIAHLETGRRKPNYVFLKKLSRLTAGCSDRDSKTRVDMNYFF